MQKDSIQEALKSLQIAKSDLENQLNDVNKAIESLRGSGATSVASKLNGYSEYNSDWGWANKFLFLLKQENRFLHFREAADIVCQLEGKGEPKDLAGKISASCQSIKGDKIVKYQATKSNQDTFWGSPKWLDKNRDIIKGYEYNGKYLHSKYDKSAPLFDI